jgi:hypothetical protein
MTSAALVGPQRTLVAVGDEASHESDQEVDRAAMSRGDRMAWDTKPDAGPPHRLLGVVEGLLEPGEEFAIELAGVADAEAMGDHAVPRARWFEATG